MVRVVRPEGSVMRVTLTQLIHLVTGAIMSGFAKGGTVVLIQNYVKRFAA